MSHADLAHSLDVSLHVSFDRCRPTTMRTLRSHAARAALLAAAVTLVSVPADAHAQFGGLKRRIGEQVTKAITGEQGESSAAPTFSARVLEIDDARIAQLVRGLGVEAAQAERSEREQAAEDARRAEYDKRAEAYSACGEPFAREQLKHAGMMMGLTLAAKREQDQKGAVSRSLQDSVAAVTARMKKLAESQQAKCGEAPAEPSFDEMGGAEGSDPESAGAKAAGLSAEQYAVLRERVAAYVQARDGRTGRYAFTAGERAAIDRHARELAAFRARLVGS